MKNIWPPCNERVQMNTMRYWILLEGQVWKKKNSSVNGNIRKRHLLQSIPVVPVQQYEATE